MHNHLVIATFALLGLFTGLDADAARPSKSACEMSYQAAASRGEVTRFDPALSVAELRAEQTYEVPGMNGQCCLRVTVSKSVTKALNEPRNHRLADKILRALAHGGTTDQGRPGVKRVTKDVWEVKIIGDLGQWRLLGCVREGKIEFSHLVSDHHAAERFIRFPPCR